MFKHIPFLFRTEKALSLIGWLRTSSANGAMTSLGSLDLEKNWVGFHSLAIVA